jgi:hypothetical protein
MIQNHIDRSVVAGGAKSGLHGASAYENDDNNKGKEDKEYP